MHDDRSGFDATATRRREIDALFAADGPLSSASPAYARRDAQVDMAQAVAATIDSRGTLVAEAGTGTGKTFAYLVPALIAGGKVIVSTGTKTLQDQLFQRDLPAVRDALKLPVTLALLKGRANYVCHYHTERNAANGRLASREDVANLRRVRMFLKTSRSGDRAELGTIAENASIWSLVTSTRDNCMGAECPNQKDCFVAAARRTAQQADVVVVNHHLFFADVMLREEGVSELLPLANTVIFDEAHQLPEVATLFFGETVGTSQLLELCRDLLAEGLTHAKDAGPWVSWVSPLERAARDLRLAFGPSTERVVLKTARDQLPPSAPLFTAIDALARELAAIEKLIDTHAERSENFPVLARRSRELSTRLASWRTAGTAEEIEKSGEPEAAYVAWVDVFASSVQLHRSPLSVAPIFTKERGNYPRAWVFTSATLATQRGTQAADFSHFTRQLGLEEAEQQVWGSPFDYQRNALLYLPHGMPEPHKPGYLDAVVERAWPLIEAAGGRAFLLCTTLRAVEYVANKLSERLERAGIALLRQGEVSRTELLDRFRMTEHALLVGSQTFWEGVDVRGKSLSLVIIDKLPFAPPDDPLLAARLSVIERSGGDPFNDHQVPAAVLALKQGAGRLIRSESDRGVLMICDPRLESRPYGRRIWRSLPPFARTRDESEAVRFMAAAVSNPAENTESDTGETA
ncbi:ATP-dependent DNA helicase [soil metagenome]